MKTNTEFKLQTYYKSELAMMYFPQSDKRNAVQNLKRWIRKCTQLTRELKVAGYMPTRKFYSRREVELIVKYLGEP